MANSVYETYNSMKQLSTARKALNLEVDDIKYIEPIDGNAKHSADDKNQINLKEIFASVEKDPQGNPITHFYIMENGTMTQIAAKGPFGLLLNTKYRNLPNSNDIISILGDIDVDKDSLLSLNYLEEISSSLNIPVEDLVSVADVNLEDEVNLENKQQNNKNKNKNKDKDQLDIYPDNTKPNEKSSQRNHKITGSEETELNQTVDQYHTLGKLLGCRRWRKINCCLY